MGNLRHYIQQHIAAARERLARLRRAHPDAYRAGLIASSSLALIVVTGSAWFVYDTVHDLRAEHRAAVVDEREKRRAPARERRELDIASGLVAVYDVT